MNFFETIKASIYNPSFYNDVVKGEGHKPFRYYFKLSLLLALIFSVLLSIKAVPELKKFLDETKVSVEQGYPKDLEIKIEKGLATTNAQEPYFVKFPETSAKIDAGMPDVENLLVIDTKSDFSLEKFQSYKTVVLLTKDSVVSVDSSSEKVTMTLLKSVPDFTVNYENLTKWLEKTDQVKKIATFSLPVLIFLGVFMGYVLKLVYLFFGALLVYFVAKYKKINLTYKKSYHVALYAVTLPTLLGVLAFFTGLKMFSLLPSIILVIAVWVNLKPETVSSVVSE